MSTSCSGELKSRSQYQKKYFYLGNSAWETQFTFTIADFLDPSLINYIVAVSVHTINILCLITASDIIVKQVCCYETKNVHGMCRNSHDVIWRSTIQEIGDCKRVLCFLCDITQIFVFFSGINRIKGVKIAVSYALLPPKVQTQVLFQNRKQIKKIVFLPAAIIARDVCSCLYLRSRDFGSMKDSGIV